MVVLLYTTTPPQPPPTSSSSIATWRSVVGPAPPPPGGHNFLPTEPVDHFRDNRAQAKLFHLCVVNELLNRFVTCTSSSSSRCFSGCLHYSWRWRVPNRNASSSAQVVKSGWIRWSASSRDRGRGLCAVQVQGIVGARGVLVCKTTTLKVGVANGVTWRKIIFFLWAFPNTSEKINVF